MAKRKRKVQATCKQKKPRLAEDSATPAFIATGRETISHPVLRSYYQTVVTLRQYLQRRLPNNHRLWDSMTHIDSQNASENQNLQRVRTLLDTVVVAYNGSFNENLACQRRSQELQAFTQQLPSSAVGTGKNPDPRMQLEVVNFVIWSLFRRQSGPLQRHLLCNGFETASAAGHSDLKLSVAPGIPGIICHFPNDHVETLTGPPWCQLLYQLGVDGDMIMVDLLCDCSLFVPLRSGNGNLYQLSGTPLSTLAMCTSIKYTGVAGDEVQTHHCMQPRKNTSLTDAGRRPSEIRFVRNKMFYARPSVNKRGDVKLGLHPIHVLNRCQNVGSLAESVHVLKHVFPRQFKLHNIFTGQIYEKGSRKQYHDYTIRDREISISDIQGTKATDGSVVIRQVHKRLRNGPLQLVQEMRRNHSRISYQEMLRYYCPVKELSSLANPLNPSSFATSVAHVSAFCRGLLAKLLPKLAWGHMEHDHNESRVMRAVDRFVQLRKFESISLGEVTDGLKISGIPWLATQKVWDNKMSHSDFLKRKELLHEFVYYIFDSILIPLIRANFYITDSNTDRNRLFYFRHDVWQRMTEAKIMEIRSTMLEETSISSTMSHHSSLPPSTIRLLPKASGFRLITNLRKRPIYIHYGKHMLGKSVNQALTPVFRVLNYELGRKQHLAGFSVLSVPDIYSKIKEFKATVGQSRPLYFAKVDIQACFDSIPQNKILQLVENKLLTMKRYAIIHFAEISRPSKIKHGAQKEILKPKVKFRAVGSSCRRIHNAEADAEEKLASTRKNAVYVGALNHQQQEKARVLDLLRDHVSSNTIKIGKNFYRQKQGVPQGSVLSSILCNIFYGDLEQRVLAFARRDDTLLLRMVDDFLIVSAAEGIVRRFLQCMHYEIEEYGISIKPEKSLTNHPVQLERHVVPCKTGEWFPFCGILINTHDLNIKKDHSKVPAHAIPDTLTAEFHTLPGKMFRQKTTNGLRIQLLKVFMDTTFNRLETVVQNLHSLFSRAALRMYYYWKTSKSCHRPSGQLIIRAIGDIIQAAWRAVKRINVSAKPHLPCNIRKAQIRWLACKAAHEVFLQRQSSHGDVVQWLKTELQDLKESDIPVTYRR